VGQSTHARITSIITIITLFFLLLIIELRQKITLGLLSHFCVTSATSGFVIVEGRILCGGAPTEDQRGL